ncbi:MAG: hypothetical protein J0H49_35285 [Acidobacteria bacterium]|nr:hypothetical protein [Acidobacteriota bacterium]
MPQNIVIGLWSNSNRWDKPLASRLLAMEWKMATVNKWMTESAAELTKNLPFKGVFLAPEYYFTGPYTERFPMPEGERINIEEKLLGLSRKFPELLLVPGTVFYAKRLVRDAGFGLKFDPVTGLRTKAKVTDADRRARAIQKTRAYIGNIPAQRGPNDEDLRFWAGSGYDAGGNQVPSLNQIRSTLRDDTKNPLLAKNAAYMLLGGRRLAKFDKQTDFGEAIGMDPENLAFIPGAFKHCPEVGGYRMGMEICFDHGNAMLARRNVQPLHFHFVVSDWVESSTGNMAMSPGGYFAHASTNYMQSSLWRRRPDGSVENITVDPAYWRWKSSPTTLLDGYVVPLPAPMTPPKRA